MDFDVPLPGPLDLALSLEGFRRNGDDLIDRWDGETLVRTVPLAGRRVAFAATPEGTVETPRLRLTVEEGASPDGVAEAVRASFLPTPEGWDDLLRRDAVIAALDRRFPGARPALQPDLLTALIRSISAQQVNLRWAATTRRRLAERFGERHAVAGHTVYAFDAATLAAADVAEIRSLQFTTRKAEYIVALARAVAGGELDLQRLLPLPDDEVIAHLSALRGVGRWTAEWILVRTMGRPVVVAGDLGVRKAVGAAYLDTPLPSEGEVRAATAHWGACAAVAQHLLLHSLVEPAGSDS